MSGRPRSSTTRSGGSAGGRAQRLGAVGGGDDVVLPGEQVDPQRAQDLGFVVDDQDARHRDASCRAGAPGAAGAGGVAAAAGRLTIMVSPPPGVASGIEGAAHGLDQAAGQGEPEARRPVRCRGRRAAGTAGRSGPSPRRGCRARGRRRAARPGRRLARRDDRRRGRAGCSAARWRRGWPATRSSSAGSARTSGRSSGTSDGDVAGRRPEVVDAPRARRRRTSMGCRSSASAPAWSRLMSSRFSTRRAQPVERLLGGRQQLGAVARRRTRRRGCAGCSPRPSPRRAACAGRG